MLYIYFEHKELHLSLKGCSEGKKKNQNRSFEGSIQINSSGLMKRYRSLQTGWFKPEPPSVIPRLICGRSPDALHFPHLCPVMKPWRDNGMDPAMHIKFCAKKWPSLEMRPSTHVVGSAGLTHSPLGVDHLHQNPTNPKIIEQLCMPEKVPSVAASSPSPWQFCLLYLGGTKSI